MNADPATLVLLKSEFWGYPDGEMPRICREEIGGAPGAAAREIAGRLAPSGHILVVDRSRSGIERTRKNCAAQIDAGLLSTLCASVEDFRVPADAERFDLAFACRVGALDGRHPRLFDAAIHNIGAALKPGGRLFVDTGNPLRQVPLTPNPLRARPEQSRFLTRRGVRLDRRPGPAADRQLCEKSLIKDEEPPWD